MSITPITIGSQAGIQRDTTRFSKSFYSDGQWVRFQNGKPRKIGGYRNINNYINGIVRAIHTQAQNNLVYTHVGHALGVQAFTIDTTGNTSAPVDRTPFGFVDNVNFMWQFDAMFDGAGGGAVIIAHSSDSALDISSSTNYPAYIGNLYGSSSLTAIPATSVSGGVCVLHPYLFMFGNNGYVQWSDVNDPTNFSSGDAGNANITSAKVVRGLPLRGGGQSPAGLFWSLDSLIRASYTGGSDVFRFDTISSSISVLAANGIVEYDGIYFWCGLDRFMYYNGVVQDLPNNMNINFFFDNLNYDCANKIFAFKVPRFGEIWWCFPKGESTECNHALIYNNRENTWYDTPLPEGGRSAGIYAQVFRSPLLAGVEPTLPDEGDLRITEASDSRITESDDFRVTDTGLTSYKFWRHETGYDAIDGSQINAIQSYFETGPISLLTGQEPQSRALSMYVIEPDFIQEGNMTVQVNGYVNSRSPVVQGQQKLFPATASTPSEQTVKFKESHRVFTVRFESNTVGGYYLMGNVVAHVQPADARYES